MDAMKSCISKHDMQGALLRARALELDMAEASHAVQDRVLVLVVLLLGEVYTADIAAARFAWRRAHPTVKADATAAAVWELCKSLWQGDTPSFFAGCSGITSPSAVARAVTATADRVRTRLLDDAERAYSCVSASSLAARAGLTEADVTTLARTRGWTQTGGMLRPPAATATAATVASSSSSSGSGEQAPAVSLLRLRQLTDAVGALEAPDRVPTAEEAGLAGILAHLEDAQNSGATRGGGGHAAAGLTA